MTIVSHRVQQWSQGTTSREGRIANCTVGSLLLIMGPVSVRGSVSVCGLVGVRVGK